MIPYCQPFQQRAQRQQLMLAALVVVIVGSISGGCVQRRLTIQSNPPGANVRVDDVEIGTTPVSTSFVYYGTRKIQIVKPGYETLTVLQPVPAPWYQWPVVDFVSEHFVPGKIRDNRTLNYELKPSAIVPTDELLRRADQLRGEAKTSAVPESITAPLPVPGQAPPALPPSSPPRFQPLPPALDLPSPPGNPLPF